MYCASVAIHPPIHLLNHIASLGLLYRKSVFLLALNQKRVECPLGGGDEILPQVDGSCA